MEFTDDILHDRIYFNVRIAWRTFNKLSLTKVSEEFVYELKSGPTASNYKGVPAVPNTTPSIDSSLLIKIEENRA